jgi:copper chaperone
MATVTYAVAGMTCGACVRHVEQALGGVPGIQSARVDPGSAAATVEHDGTPSFAQLREAVERAGYSLQSAGSRRDAASRGLVRTPLLVGFLAGLGLLAVYAGLLSLVQGRDHALQ